MDFLDTIGSISAVNGNQSVNCRGIGTIGVEISGTFVGTLVFEFTIDGTIWHSIRDLLINQSQTTTGAFQFNVAGFSEFRVRSSAWTSGTANLLLHADSMIQSQTHHISPNIFKTVQASASGNTAVWTPASGKKFRLTDLFIDLTENATLGVAGEVTISLQDGTTPMNIAFDVYIPSSGTPQVGAAFTTGQIELINGILSTTANNILNVNLSAALTAGHVRVNVMGVEE